MTSEGGLPTPGFPGSSLLIYIRSGGVSISWPTKMMGGRPPNKRVDTSVPRSSPERRTAMRRFLLVVAVGAALLLAGPAADTAWAGKSGFSGGRDGGGRSFS